MTDAAPLKLLRWSLTLALVLSIAWAWYTDKAMSAVVPDVYVRLLGLPAWAMAHPWPAASSGLFFGYICLAIISACFKRRR